GQIQALQASQTHTNDPEGAGSSA
ncbi:hypothetical protein Tco_1389063, partial [Tanacetum coccineum]